MTNCPNCHKTLHWVPKGKHTCLCGEVIETDGKDLLEVEIAMINVAPEQERSHDVEILIGLTIMLLLSLAAVGVFYHEVILSIEAGIVQAIFGVDPAHYKQALAPFIAAAALTFWLASRTVKKIRGQS